MPRYKLKEAREKAGLTQSALADLVGCERKAPNYWEAGTASPRGIYREKILEVLKDVLKDVLTEEDADLFKNYPERPSERTISSTANICPQLDTQQQMSTTCQTMENRDILESTNPHTLVIPGTVKGFITFVELVRRQFIEITAKFGLAAYFGNIELALVSSAKVDPEEYLDLCSESIDTWGEWLNQGNYTKVERVLLKNVPVLTRLANTISSPFQGKAASLAVRAKIMQIILAIHKFDFLECEAHCVEAVRLGGLSGNHTVLAVALDWQGSTYVYCYRDPQRAIDLFDDALTHLGSNDLLNRSSIYSSLSIAYAQRGDEIKAMEYAGMARSAMPPCPELDPFYPWLGVGPSEFDQFEGMALLCLAEHTHSRKYAELARDAFKKSVSKQATDKDYPCGSLIKKADAARVLGDMNGCVKDLTKGYHMGDEIKSLRRLIEAYNVISNMSDAWKRETSVQDLQKDISHAIVVARQ